MSIRSIDVQIHVNYFACLCHLSPLFFTISLPRLPFSASFHSYRHLFLDISHKLSISHLPYMVMLLCTCKHIIDHLMLTKVSQCFWSHQWSPDSYQNCFCTFLQSSWHPHYSMVVICNGITTFFLWQQPHYYYFLWQPLLRVESGGEVSTVELFKEDRHTIICVLENIYFCHSTVIIGIHLLPRPDYGLAKGSIEFIKSGLMLCSWRDHFLKLGGHELALIIKVSIRMKCEI